MAWASAPVKYQERVMIDPDAAIDAHLRRDLQRTSIDKLGMIYDPTVVERMLDCAVTRIRAGTVGDGITHAELVNDASVPTWVRHQGLIGHLLALVSLQSYAEHGVLVSALVRARDDDVLPTEGFCGFLEELGLVRSRLDRDECLEMWDHHWKRAVTRLDVRHVDD